MIHGWSPGARCVVTVAGQPWPGTVTENTPTGPRVHADCGEHSVHPAGQVWSIGQAIALLHAAIVAGDAAIATHRSAGNKPATRRAEVRTHRLVFDLITIQREN